MWRSRAFRAGAAVAGEVAPRLLEDPPTSGLRTLPIEGGAVMVGMLVVATLAAFLVADWSARRHWRRA